VLGDAGSSPAASDEAKALREPQGCPSTSQSFGQFGQATRHKVRSPFLIVGTAGRYQNGVPVNGSARSSIPLNLILRGPKSIMRVSADVPALSSPSSVSNVQPMT